MEILFYLRLFRKRAIPILLIVLTLTGVAYFVTKSRPLTYEAETMVLIGGFIQSANPDSTDITAGMDLARMYTEILATDPVLQGVIDTLDLSMSLDSVQNLIDTHVVAGTSLFVIKVTYTDAALAADIANQVAEQLILHSPTNLTSAQEVQINFANEQITALSTQLDDFGQRLEDIDNQLQQDPSASLMELRVSLLNQITQTFATIAEFSTTIGALQQRVNAVSIVERARIPSAPSGASPLSRALLVAVLSGAFTFAFFLFLEHIDDSIRTIENVDQLQLQVLGRIQNFGKKRNVYPSYLVVREAPISQAAEGYRFVRTALLANNKDNQKGIYVVASPRLGEGKSVTIANLAVTIAQAGLKVLLIDCDLRQPALHKIFNLSNDVGITTLLGTNSDIAGREQGQKLALLFDKYVQTTDIPNLSIITSGPLSMTQTELMGSSAIKDWGDIFRTTPDIDIVLFDTPATLTTPDSAILAVSAGADVLLVIQSGRTTHDAALKAVKLFGDAGIHIRGVILNRMNPREIVI